MLVIEPTISLKEIEYLIDNEDTFPTFWGKNEDGTTDYSSFSIYDPELVVVVNAYNTNMVYTVFRPDPYYLESLENNYEPRG